MFRTIQVALNQFAPLPSSLCKGSDPTAAVETVNVDLAKLYHHYYEDKWGCAPPNPDPTRFEHVQFLAATPDFRFSAGGLGVNKTGKSNTSNELGQASCRWFLSEFLDITYFAHFDDVCGHGALNDYGGISISKQGEGLAPDYFCSRSASEVYLAEAKGDTQAINFGTKKFESWRKQFDCVEVCDAGGAKLSIKGFISGTRWAFESQPGVKSRISVEDPRTPGERSLGDLSPALASAITSIHYSKIAEKLRLHPLSAVLRTGVQFPPELSFRMVVWQFLVPPLQGKRFVGGYFPAEEGRLPIEIDQGRIIVRAADPLRLDVAGGTFFGVEESIFEKVMTGAREGPRDMRDLPRLREIPFVDSSVSMLADGTAIAPVQMLMPVETRDF